MIAATGIENHDEFVQMVEEIMANVRPKGIFRRTESEYKGGIKRIEVPDSEALALNIAFESVPWTHEDSTTFYVMNQIFGSASGFSVGGPGKGMYCRAIMNLLIRYAFINNVSGINNIYTDTGLFGIDILGTPQGKDLTIAILQQLYLYTEPIHDDELE